MYARGRVKVYTRHNLSNPVKIGFDSSPPGRVQTALTTGTQGWKSLMNGIGEPSPLVGSPGANGELASTPQKSDCHYITMLRVPGSSGDSGDHHGALGKDVRIKTERKIKASEAEGSLLTRKMKSSSRGGALITR